MSSRAEARSRCLHAARAARPDHQHPQLHDRAARAHPAVSGDGEWAAGSPEAPPRSHATPQRSISMAPRRVARSARLEPPRLRPGCAGLRSSQAKRKLTGIMNFTNPGAISHNEVRAQRAAARSNTHTAGMQQQQQWRCTQRPAPCDCVCLLLPWLAAASGSDHGAVQAVHRPRVHVGQLHG